MEDASSYDGHEADCLSASTRLEIEVVDGGNTANSLVSCALIAVSQRVRHNEACCRIRDKIILLYNFQHNMRGETIQIYVPFQS
jgi:hypothetical protein